MSHFNLSYLYTNTIPEFYGWMLGFNVDVKIIETKGAVIKEILIQKNQL